MIDLRRIENVSKWLIQLRDRRAKAVILKRLRRVSLGHLGDVAAVGEGVSELRIHHGPGYRVYFTSRKRTIIPRRGQGIAEARHRRARELSRTL